MQQNRDILLSSLSHLGDIQNFNKISVIEAIDTLPDEFFKILGLGGDEIKLFKRVLLAAIKIKFDSLKSI